MIRLEKETANKCRLICDEEHRGMPDFKASNGWFILSLGFPAVYYKYIYVIGSDKQYDLDPIVIYEEWLPFVEEAIAEFNESLNAEK